MLDAKPELIAAAANALCSDDAKEKNAFDTVKYFERRDCVMHLVTFTRCLYAMLTTNERVMPNVRSNGWFMTKDFEHIEKEYKLGYKIVSKNFRIRNNYQYIKGYQQLTIPNFKNLTVWYNLYPSSIWLEITLFFFSIKKWAFYSKQRL